MLSLKLALVGLLMGSAVAFPKSFAAAAKTSETAVCTPTPATPAPKGFHCGDEGYVQDKTFLARFQSCTNSYVGCYETCASDPACESFVYAPLINYCRTFDSGVDALDFTHSKTSGDYFYNLKHCFTPASCSHGCKTKTVTSSSTSSSTLTSSTSYMSSSTSPTATPTPSQIACGNQGLQFAVYPNYAGNNPGDGYSNFDPTIYKSMAPEYNSVTTTVGGITVNADQDELISVYNTPYAFESDYFVLNHRGYIFAPQTGTYTINLDSADDIALVWVGELAFAGWDRPNDNIDGGFDNGPGVGSYQFSLVQGEYIALRIVYANAQGDATFDISVTNPDGTTLLDSSTVASPYIVQYSCDLVTAPEYLPFGEEV